MTTTVETLTRRLQRLEAIEAIRTLKARYLSACDAKQVDSIRDCFVDGEVIIDYGAVGRFTHREQLLDVFTQFACNDYVHDLHLGGNPQIGIIDDTNARGTWTLLFFQVNTAAQTVMQMGCTYDDTYRRVDGEWKIVTTRSRPHVSELMKLEDGLHRIQFAGSAMKTFG